MNRTLVFKSIGESALLLGSCVGGLILFCWVRVWIVSQIEMSRFQAILENLPESFQRLAPVPIQQLLTYEGRIALGFEEPMLYLIMAVWCIARGSDVVSGELNRGTLEMLVAQPVSRARLMAVQGAMTLLGVVVLGLAAYVGTCCGIWTSSVQVVSEPLRVTVPWLNIELPLSMAPPEVRQVPLRTLVQSATFVPAVLNYICLGVFLSGLTMLVSSADRYRWRTIGLVVAFYVSQTLLELLGQSLDLAWLRRLTFFSAYEPVRFVTRSLSDSSFPWQVWGALESGEWLGPIGCNLVLLGLGLASFLAGLWVFTQRDLAAPV